MTKDSDAKAARRKAKAEKERAFEVYMTERIVTESAAIRAEWTLAQEASRLQGYGTDEVVEVMRFRSTGIHSLDFED